MRQSVPKGDLRHLTPSTLLSVQERRETSGVCEERYLPIPNIVRWQRGAVLLTGGCAVLSLSLFLHPFTPSMPAG